jgi:deoxyribodipyrimidine photo-lyase
VELTAWQRGRTGIPLVDAGMRELWNTGYIHNRLLMVVGSFLVKNLMLRWRHGAAWFNDYLVDADLANNSAGWQWIAGSGADAAPYFRIFNPVTQGRKFDPSGDYTRRHVPELAHLPEKYLFSPWQAPASVLKQAGVELGETYPEPIVDLSTSRQRALDAFASLSNSGTERSTSTVPSVSVAGA